MSAARSLSTQPTWTLNLEDSYIRWQTRKMFVIPVHGHFKTWSGVVEIDPVEPSASLVDVQIDLASVHTGRGPMAGFGVRDWTLRSPLFFGIQQYPEARFRSENIQISDDRVDVDGILDLHGMRRPIALSGRIEVLDNVRFMLHLSTVIDRYDFGVTMGKLAEGFGTMLSNQNTVEIQIALTRP